MRSTLPAKIGDIHGAGFVDGEPIRRPGCIPYPDPGQQAIQVAARLLPELTNETKSCSERAAEADKVRGGQVLLPAQPTAETKLEIERTGDLTAEDAEC